MEAAGRFPIHDVFKKMADLGLLGICKPEENGGLGLDYSYNLVVAEELGRAKGQYYKKRIFHSLFILRL